MAISFQVITLARGEAKRLSMTKSQALGLLRGGVWLTKSGDMHDYFLHAGDRLALRVGDSVVLESLQLAGQEPASLGLEVLEAGIEIDYNSALNAQTC